MTLTSEFAKLGRNKKESKTTVADPMTTAAHEQ